MSPGGKTRRVKGGLRSGRRRQAEQNQMWGEFEKEKPLVTFRFPGTRLRPLGYGGVAFGFRKQNGGRSSPTGRHDWSAVDSLQRLVLRRGRSRVLDGARRRGGPGLLTKAQPLGKLRLGGGRDRRLAGLRSGRRGRRVQVEIKIVVHFSVWFLRPDEGALLVWHPPCRRAADLNNLFSLNRLS